MQLYLVTNLFILKVLQIIHISNVLHYNIVCNIDESYLSPFQLEQSLTCAIFTGESN